MATQHPGISWTTLVSSLGLAFIVGGAGWTLFQDKFTVAKESDAELRQQVRALQNELKDRQHQFISNETFSQFEKRFNSVERRLDTIEQTRPTTGELSAVANGTKDVINRIEERVRALESAPRFPKSPQ